LPNHYELRLDSLAGPEPDPSDPEGPFLDSVAPQCLSGTNHVLTNPSHDGLAMTRHNTTHRY